MLDKWTVTGIPVSNGATYIRTHGYGIAGTDGISQLRDIINEIGGKAVFDNIDSVAAFYAHYFYKGC